MIKKDAGSKGESARKPYLKPRFFAYGTVQSLTHGNTGPQEDGGFDMGGHMDVDSPIIIGGTLRFPLDTD